MSRFIRSEVTAKAEATGMIPVFYHADIEICKAVLRACYNGGVRLFEFTNRGDFAHELFGELVKFAAKEMPDLILGAGTIMDAASATLFIQNGANFIVSPIVKEETAKVCNRRKVAWLPGCATLTEISLAEELGADIVKIFPGFVLGPKFVSAAKGPFPWVKLMPTGGVEPTKESLTEWFKAGVTCVGIGSQLFPAKVLAEQNYRHIEDTCQMVMSIIQQLRNT
jgi:2-dehydro-3-deoxyphosphogluconate aldolase/(4S)-4-hydroxy-2-oxoglutarate aldolase